MGTRTQDGQSRLSKRSWAAGALTGALGAELVGHVQQGQQGHQAVVAVGLDEVVSGDGCGVDVMLSEGSNESLGWGWGWGPEKGQMGPVGLWRPAPLHYLLGTPDSGSPPGLWDARTFHHAADVEPTRPSGSRPKQLWQKTVLMTWPGPQDGAQSPPQRWEGRCRRSPPFCPTLIQLRTALTVAGRPPFFFSPTATPLLVTVSSSSSCIGTCCSDGAD